MQLRVYLLNSWHDNNFFFFFPNFYSISQINYKSLNENDTILHKIRLTKLTHIIITIMYK